MIDNSEAISLIESLAHAGVALSIDPRNRLHVEAAPGILTAELKARIAKNKPDLVKIVQFSECQGCRSREFIDVAIHDGRSVRRDCKRCGRTAGFPIWNPVK